MTTLIGIKAEEAREGVILASDLFKTYSDLQKKRGEKYEGQKIYVSDNRELAICMSGDWDQAYVDFLSDILKGRIDMKKAIKKEFLSELLNLHLLRWGGYLPIDNQSSLLLATRFDNKPSLYTCWPLGKLEGRIWTSIGSGSDYVIDFIRKQGKDIPPHISLEQGIDLVVNGMDEAFQDIHTGGLDLVIVTSEGIQEYRDKIKDSINLAKRRSINEIKEKYIP